MYPRLLIAICALLCARAVARAAPVFIPATSASAPAKTEAGHGVCATAVHVADTDVVTSLDSALFYLSKQPGMNKVDQRVKFPVSALDLRNSDMTAAGDYDADQPLPFTARPGTAAAGDGRSIAMRVRGYLNVTRTGIFTFAVLADDGYSLSIGGQAVLKSTTVGMSVRDSRQVSFAATGLYPLELVYFQNIGAAVIEIGRSNNANVEVTAFPQSLGPTFKLVPTEDLFSAVAGRSNCAECSQSPECGAGAYCRDGLCQDCIIAARCGPSCVTCPDGAQVCYEGRCVECSSKDASACDRKGYICDTNQCVPCISDTQCGDGRICDRAFGQCIARTDLQYAGGCSVGGGAEGLAGAAIALCLLLLARRRRRRPFAEGALGVGALVLLPQVARAQDAAPQAAFNAQTFRPTLGPGNLVTVEGTQMPRSPWPMASLVLDFADRPVRLVDASGAYANTVSHMLTTHFLVGAGVTRWLSLSLDVPVVLSQGFDERTPEADVPSVPSRAGIGDMRLSAKLRLIDNEGGGFGLAIVPQILFPTGSATSFRGEDTLAVEPRVALDYRFKFGLAIIANLGVFARTYNQNLDFGRTRVPSHVTYGLGAAMNLPKGFGAGLELAGGIGLSALEGGALYAPAELSFFGRWAAKSGIGAFAGVAPGLSGAVGSPAVRIFAGFTYAPRALPPGPRPKETVRVIRIREPAAQPGARGPAQPLGYPGAPMVLDSDGDGLQDLADRCPFLRGPIDSGGCPVSQPDRDQDGVPDSTDRCPDRPGTAQLGGCPEPRDSDRDGIDDSIDRCPNQAGAIENGGCPPGAQGVAPAPAPTPAPAPAPLKPAAPAPAGPLVEVGQTSIKLLVPIRFQPGSIPPDQAALPVLIAVARALVKDPSIKKASLVVPEGEGPKLGKLRVAALRAALVGGGVTKKRLQLDSMPVPGEEVISEITLTRGGKGAKGQKGQKGKPGKKR